LSRAAIAAGPAPDGALGRVLAWLSDRPRLSALAGAACIAFSGILFRTSGSSPSTATFFRCLYGLPLLVALGWYEHRRFGPPAASTVRFAVLAGVFFAGDLLFWSHAIEAVGAGLATVLGNLQVVVVGIAAWLLFGERPTRLIGIALAIVLVGVVLISGVVGGGAYGADPPLGMVFGLVTAICYGAYLLTMRHGGRDLRRSAGPVAISTAATALVALVAGAIVGDLDLVPSWPSVGWLVLYGVTSQSLGYVLISISLPRLPAVLTSIILLSQPIATVLLGIVLLGEAPSPLQLAGVALVMAGVALASGIIDRWRSPAEARAVA
jgi:drug/metabolite transporter (DMT)-like permease